MRDPSSWTETGTAGEQSLPRSKVSAPGVSSNTDVLVSSSWLWSLGVCGPGSASSRDAQWSGSRVWITASRSSTGLVVSVRETHGAEWTYCGAGSSGELGDLLVLGGVVPVPVRGGDRRGGDPDGEATFAGSADAEATSGLGSAPESSP